MEFEIMTFRLNDLSYKYIVARTKIWLRNEDARARAPVQKVFGNCWQIYDRSIRIENFLFVNGPRGWDDV